VQKNPRPLLSLDSGLPEDQSAQNLEAMANHSSYFKFDASSASGRPTSVWIMLTRHFQWRNPTEREIGISARNQPALFNISSRHSTVDFPADGSRLNSSTSRRKMVLQEIP